MKTTINFSEFRDLFQKIRPDNFSYQGQKILFDYFEDYEQSAREELECDVIAICCDFAESDWQTIARDYDSLSDCREKVEVLDFLADQGALIGETDSSIVYRQF
jgi:hypothetical protein